MFRRTLRDRLHGCLLRHFSRCLVLFACGIIAACGQQNASNDTAKNRGADQDQSDSDTNPANMVVLVADHYSSQIEHEGIIQSPNVQIHLDSDRTTYVADCAHSYFLQLPDGRELSLGLPAACDGKPSIDVRQRAIQPPIPENGPKGLIGGTNWSIAQKHPRRPTRRCEQRELVIDAGEQCIGFGSFWDALKDIGLTDICNSVGLGHGLHDMAYYGFPGPNNSGTGGCPEMWQSTQFYMTCCIAAPQTRITQFMLLEAMDWANLDDAQTLQEEQLRLGVRYTTQPFTGAVPHAEQHVALSEPFRISHSQLVDKFNYLEERRSSCRTMNRRLTSYSRRINAPAPANADNLLKDHYSDLVTWHVWYEDNIGEVSWYLPKMWTRFVESTGRSWRDFRESVCFHALANKTANSGLRKAVDCADLQQALSDLDRVKGYIEQLECEAWLATDDSGSSELH